MIRIWRLVSLALLALLPGLTLLLSCSAPGASGQSPNSGAGSPAAPAPVIGPAGSALVAVPPPPADGEGPVPIHPDDARLGPSDAEVTIVYVTDLQCPFCARADVTLHELQNKYGSRLRIVMKHLPLDFHPMALPAAHAAIRVQREEGDAAFFRFVTLVLENQASLREETLARWASSVRGSEAQRRSFTGSPEEQLQRDLTWASSHRIYGTPNFLVNGKRIAGAQPLPAFVAVIDQELADIAAARAEGKPVRYSDRTAVNYQAPEEPVALAGRGEDPDEGRIYNVPVGNSPVWGAPDALVTIVEFSDYQCPFCKRAQRTMELLQQKYGGDLRVVFKHHPLPFHDRAGPAAGLALEAYRELGNAAFWQATRSLFEAPHEALTDASLESLGKSLKLNPKKVRAAVQLGAKDPVILADIALADALSAQGTPAFFVNGQKLVGAQPLAVFEEAVEAQLVAARAMVKAGAARSEVYERIMTLAGGR